MEYKDDKWWLDHYNKHFREWVVFQMTDPIEGMSNCGKYKVFRPQKEIEGYVNKQIVKYCEKYIAKAKEEYYNRSNKIMSDEQFDLLEKILRLNDPSNVLLIKVGG